MTTSYEKFIIDEEILSRVIRIQQGKKKILKQYQTKKILTNRNLLHL